MKIDFVKEKNVKGKIILREKWFGGKTDKDLGETGLRGKKGEEADSEEKNWFKGENDYGERLI